jgi:hypothetical protein
MPEVKNIQNAWTKRQVFNPDTLVLAGPGGQMVRINTQPVPPAGTDGVEYEVQLPSPGTTIGGISSINSFNQNIGTVVQTVTFSEDVQQFGNAPHRNGGTFTIQQSGKYYVGVSLHIEHLQTNNTTRFWLLRNGVASVPYFGTTMDLKQQGDIGSLNFQGYLDFNEGDQIIIRAVASLANGCRLQALAASGEAPAVPGSVAQFIGYLRRSTDLA